MLTPEQNKVRAGRITGSVMSIIMDGGMKAWCTLLDQKKLEIEQPDIAFGEQVTAPSLSWGTANEPLAIANYEIINATEVVKPKLSIIHPKHDFIACIPDFLDEDHIVGEVKCPFNEEIHAMTVVYGTGAESYKPQIQAELAVTQRDVCKFVSYDPRYPDPDKQIIVIDVLRDEKYIDKMIEKCTKFNDFLVSDTRPDIGFTTEVPTIF